MSDSKRKNPYTPARLTRPTRMTIDDIQQLGGFFKELIDSSGLKVWIILAGLGSAVEIAHIIWLAVRYVYKF